MRYANIGARLRLSVEAKGRKIRDDERARMDEAPAPLREAALAADPEGEHDNASLARTLRQTPL